MRSARHPFVSVIMPVYNHAAFVVDAAQSVLEQIDVELELIIIDDASTDTSWNVLETLHDSRIQRLRHSENQGAHVTLNQSLALARGEFIAIINSDDLFLPTRLSRCIAHMQAQQLDLVGTDIQLIDSWGRLVTEHWWIQAFDDLKQRWQSTHDWASTLLYGNVFMTTSNFVMRRSALEHLGAFSADRYVHDYDYLLRALTAGLRLGWLDEPLLHYRLHESNTISSRPLEANRECAALLRRTLPKLQAFLADAEHGKQRIGAMNAQWARMDRYVDEIWSALQHHALVAKENELLPLIAERDNWIQERDALIKQRDYQIHERDLWIRERDALIQQRDQWVSARDEWMAERDCLIKTLQTHAEALQGTLQKQQQTTTQLSNELSQTQQTLNEIHASLTYQLARLLGWPLKALRRLSEEIVRFNLKANLHRLASFLRVPQLPHDASIQRVTSLAALENTLAALAPGVRCISFDVFDTLLARCIEPPDSLQRRVCAKIAQKLGAGHNTESVWQARLAVESELRHACLTQGGDHECHFEPLVEAWVERLLGHQAPELVAWIHRCNTSLNVSP